MPATIDPDIILGFLDEVEGYRAAIRDGLARLRETPADLAALEEPHRCVHTIKGAAAMVGLTAISHIAYQVEEALDELTHGQLSPDADVLAGLDLGVDAIFAATAQYATDGRVEDALVAGAVAALRQLRGLPTVVGTGPDADVLPLPNPLAFADTELDLPALASFDTTADGDLPFPDFLAASAAVPTPTPVAPPPDAPAELLEVFQLEADDHLRVLLRVLPLARTQTVSKDDWQEVRRAAHTLKGAAAMVGFTAVTTLAHRMEDLLDLYYEQDREPTADELDLLLASADAIEDTVAARPPAVALTALIARYAPPHADEPTAVPEAVAIAPVTAPPAAAARPRRDTAEASVRVPLDRLDDIAKLVGELVISRTAFEQRMIEFRRLLGELDPSTGRLRRTSQKLDAGYEAVALAGDRRSQPGDNGDGFDALEFDRYTEFHLISRELAETTTDVLTLSGELGHLATEFEGHLTRQSRLSSQIEDRLMQMRMVPLATAVPRLQRTVRNAAETTGKRAELVVVGERTGLDKAVLEAMGDPLLHLLRNAVDHGLESAEVRRAVGKPEAGTVTLTARHQGSQVVVTVADDGRGIDPEAVRAKAVERGRVTADAAPALTEEQLFALVFAPGFSTKDEVSELSGRGVGLDVVKAKTEALKGTVHVASVLGRGTTFTVRLPMTLAVTRALLVRANRQTFAIPLEFVEQIVRLDETGVETVGRERVARIGDGVHPFTRLGELMALRTPAEELGQRTPVLLVRAGDRRLAVGVDHLVGGREVVIKSLGSHLKRVAGVSGATFLGDGSVVLILNPDDWGRRSVAAIPHAPVAPAVARAKTVLDVLVVDDSPSVRRVLTGLVERCGWTATVARDGLEALELLQQAGPRPDVVLSDIEMPRMDGYELLSTVRSLPGLTALPVVVITSRSAEKHRKRAMDLGASAYVAKPYQEESLVELIRRLTAQRA